MKTEKYGDVEAHYIKMEFMRDTSMENRYFNINNKKSRLFKMIRFTRENIYSRKYTVFHLIHCFPHPAIIAFGCPAITSLKY